MQGDPTEINVPLPRRPEYGLSAWLATIGYISEEYSPDAMLTMRVQPSNDGALVWSAQVSWGEHQEAVEGLPSLAEALRKLWRTVSQSHHLFKSLDAAVRQPTNYPADKWIDPPTQQTLERLLPLSKTAFADDWLLVIIYQAVDNPEIRARARLLAKNNSVHVGGRGASIQEACRDLYIHIAPGTFKQGGESRED